MAREIVEAVRQAEREASQMEAQAAQDAKNIVEEAKGKASRSREQRIAQARSDEEAAMETARSQCEAMMQEADIRAKSEEERFHETLEEGLAILNNLIAKAKSTTNEISGKDAFKLYDTYGFPVELTEEIATQENLSVDMNTFDDEMQKQRDRARQARQNSQRQTSTLLYESF